MSERLGTGWGKVRVPLLSPESAAFKVKLKSLYNFKPKIKVFHDVTFLHTPSASNMTYFSMKIKPA